MSEYTKAEVMAAFEDQHPGRTVLSVEDGGLSHTGDASVWYVYTADESAPVRLLLPIRD